MASFNVPIDLLSYLGAQYTYVPFRAKKEGESDEDYRKNGCQRGVFIPTDLNNIKVEKDSREEKYANKSGCTATLRVNLYPPKNDDKYVSAVKQGLAKDGKEETHYNIPSHEVKPSFSKEYYERMRPIFIRKAELIHSELKGKTPEESEEMRKVMNSFTPYRVGYAWQIEPKTKEPVAPAPTATNSGYYVPQSAAVDEDPFAGGYIPSPEDEDLPF